MASRPRRVLFVLNSASTAGANRSLAVLLSRLDRSRYEPHAIVPRDGPMVARLDELGVPVQVLPLSGLMRLRASTSGKVKAAVRNGRNLVRLTRRIRREGIHLVHTNTIFPLGGALAARLAGVPHVWHVREGLDAPIYRPRLSKKRTLGIMAALSDHLVCISQYVARVSVAPAARSRTTVVYNPLDELPDTRERAPEPPFVIGCLGLISRQKRTIEFIEAAGRIAEAIPGTRFVVAGRPGSGEESLLATCRRRADELGIGDRVTFPGFVSDPEQVYREIDLLLHPAVHEGFGRVIVEAMSWGIPVVGVESGALPEIIHDGETGRLVPPDDSAALARAAVEIMGDPALYSRLEQAARADVARRFAARAHADAVMAIYHRLLGDSR